MGYTERCHSCDGSMYDLPPAACSNRLYHRTPTTMRHWVTQVDLDAGQLFEELCDCEIGENHNDLGDLIGLSA